MSEQPSFDAVMSQLRVGSHGAAAQVFQRFAGRLIALARSRLDSQLRTKIDPEDVLQSVFRSFFVRHADGQFDPQDWDSLWTLLTVITLRKCGRWHAHFRTERRALDRELALPPVTADSGAGWEILAEAPTPVEAALLAEMVELLLSSLEGRDREIATLALQGHTPAEISDQLRRPVRTVYRVLAQIKKRLQRLRDGDED